MTRPSVNMIPIYFSYFLVTILLFQTIRPVQSIALSSLCGQFGHSCFGGNWGKRELPTSSLTSDVAQLDLNTNDDGTSKITTVDDEYDVNNLLEEIRLNLLRHRFRQLLKLE